MVSSSDEPVPKSQKATRKRKASRACLNCQRAHLVCNDSRPCDRCAKRGIECGDGLRKRSKYLEGVEDDDLGFKPSVESTRAHFAHEHEAEAAAKKAADAELTATTSAQQLYLTNSFEWQPSSGFGSEMASHEHGFLSDMLGRIASAGQPTDTPPAELPSFLFNNTLPAPAQISAAMYVNGLAAAPTASTSELVKPDEVYNKVTTPFPYAQSYHALIRHLKENLIALQSPLSYDDEVFIEKAVQRRVIELEKLVAMTGTPTIVWRRTGELLLVSDEYLQLTGRSRSDLVGKGRFMWELLDQASVVTYYEGFAQHAFENSTQAFMSSCVLLGSSDAPIPCAVSYAIRRDLFFLPLLVIASFLPSHTDAPIADADTTAS